MNSPVFTLVAGPNGSGKSSLTGGNLDFFSAYPLLDPDVLARTIQADPASASPLAAGREVLSKVSGYLHRRESFAIETTLSGKHYLHTMRHACNLGFAVRLVFVGTSDVEINLKRIEKRVLGGGHSVPEPDVRRRYTRSIHNLTIAVDIAEFAIVFDNSTRLGYRVVATFDHGRPTWFNPVPNWLLPLKAHLQKQ